MDDIMLQQICHSFVLFYEKVVSWSVTLIKTLLNILVGQSDSSM